jgi:hypothetical protein
MGRKSRAKKQKKRVMGDGTSVTEALLTISYAMKMHKDDTGRDATELICGLEMERFLIDRLHQDDKNVLGLQLIVDSKYSGLTFDVR